MQVERPARLVYLDHAATTPLRQEVLEAMLPYLRHSHANPSSIHLWGREARRAVERARAEVATLIGAKPEEVVFTSGGTEANNLAILGVAYANAHKGRHLMTSAIEHHSVLETFHYLERRGFQVTYLPVTAEGLVEPETVANAITSETILISIMHANNEVGTIQPIAAIGQMARERGIVFHSDAVQSAGYLPIDTSILGVDLLSLSAHKMYGPKGVGALYVREGTHLAPVIHGGGQERGLRPGTENTPGIVGFGRAAVTVRQEMPTETTRLEALRDRLVHGLVDRLPDAIITGHRLRRLPNHVSLCLTGLEGEALLLNLELYGVAASAGAACSSGSLEPSHVLLAMGFSPEVARGSLRFTLGHGNTEQDVDYVLEVLPRIARYLRSFQSG